MWPRLQSSITWEGRPTTTTSGAQRQRGHRATGHHAEVASVDALKIWHNQIENMQPDLNRPVKGGWFCEDCIEGVTSCLFLGENMSQRKMNRNRVIIFLLVFCIVPAVVARTPRFRGQK